MTLSLTYQPTADVVALLFPGQGSQQVGMAQELVSSYPAARSVMEEADDVLGFALSTLCYNGPEEVLTDTTNVQPALLAVGMASLAALQTELGTLPRPRLFAGHSMGEYSALVAAGSLTFADGLRLVRLRGKLMAEAGKNTPGLMAALLALDEETVAELCQQAERESGGVARIANDNCPGQLVISGDSAGMERAMELAREAGARRVVPLAVSIAAHSPLMAPAVAPLAEAIENTEVAPPVAPVIANTSAEPIEDAPGIRRELVAQLTGSVRWTRSMQTALDAGVTTFLEAAPGDVLSGLLKRIQRSSERISLATAAQLRTAARRFDSTRAG